MNPQSAWTFHRRHLGSTLLLVSLIALATMGVSVMVGMLNPVLDHNSLITLGPLNRFSMVYPAAGSSLDQAVTSLLRARPDVEKVTPENGMGINISVPSLVVRSPIRVLGIREADLEYVIEISGLRLKAGRLIRPRMGEILLSEEVAGALGLRVGDHLDRSVSEDYYREILAPLELVGILESDPSVDPEHRARLAIVSYEYLQNHELYTPRQSGVIVVARPSQKASVDQFLEGTVRSKQTLVETHDRRSQLLARNRRSVSLILGLVDILVAVVSALVIGMINLIAMTRRLPEFGVLHAIGHHRQSLIRRLVCETAIVAGVGWLAGAVCAWLALAWLRTAFYAPLGVELNLANLTPVAFSAPIPLAVIASAALTTARAFARFDCVSIIERGKLSMEQPVRERAGSSAQTRPLSCLTFYRRHRRRVSVLIAIMGLMVLAVAMPVFWLSPMIDALEPVYLNYLQYVADVHPASGRFVDPGVRGRISAHPSVERVIPARLVHLAISVPPVSENLVPIYGVSESDRAYLMELWGLRLVEGRLPRVRHAEIVLSEELALNRGLQVGDRVGRSLSERDADIPTEMAVVGILRHDPSAESRTHTGQGTPDGNLSVGFVSSEYLESHEFYLIRPLRLLVVPIAERKAEMDRWLKESVASDATLVATYGSVSDEMRASARSFLLLLGGAESVVAVVAAFALAALNYIFFSQRRGEFGVLCAVGRSRAWLMLRSIKETAGLVAGGWLVGALVCLAGLLYAQANVYAPAGLSVNLRSLLPWLFTLPIPVAVLLASTSAVARLLFRLDPVSIIERR